MRPRKSVQYGRGITCLPAICPSTHRPLLSIHISSQSALSSAGCSELLASWHTSPRTLGKASQGCPTTGSFKSALEGHGLIKAIGQDADERVSGSGRINRLDRLRFDTLAVPVRVKGKRPERARGDDAKAALARQI